MEVSSVVTADEWINRLDRACQAVGLKTGVWDPRTKIRVYLAHGSKYTSELITIKPKPDGGALYWWWSWDQPICPAHEISQAVEMIKHVISITA